MPKRKTGKRQHNDPDNPKGTLSAKQRAFVEAYLETGIASAAYRASHDCSGLADTTVWKRAHDLRETPKIQAAVQAGRERACEKFGVSAERIIAELVKVAFVNITDVVEWGTSVPLKNEATGAVESVNGIVLKDSSGLGAAAVAAISEISQSKDGSLKVKLHDKLSALEKLGRHVGLFPQQVKGDINHKHRHELEPVSDSAAWLAGLLGGAADIEAEVPLPD